MSTIHVQGRPARSARAGVFVPQPSGYTAFHPAPLPPDPPIALVGQLAKQLSDADLALGRLDGVIEILPNPDLFLAMYVKQEAVLSSQIEGTQASLTDVLQFEVSEEEGDDERLAFSRRRERGAATFSVRSTCCSRSRSSPPTPSPASWACRTSRPIP